MQNEPLKTDFARRLIAWQKAHGRNQLPWQGTRDPYRIWLSEVMLQQTQVATVIPYYLRFLDRFPDIGSLARATEEDVLTYWAGLGYYSRGRNLHQAARRISQDHQGNFPQDLSAIEALPGIGRSTAAAIAAFAFEQRRAILDGNVKRVLARVFGIEGWPGERAVETRMWSLADELLPLTDIPAYTQGLMDLGATVCTRRQARCAMCPFTADCHASRYGRQDELPTSRPRRALPLKSTAMLILLHDEQVLLEKRPGRGIWGGLWSLPECSASTSAHAAAMGLGYRALRIDEHDVVSHTFTHYRLAIHPWLIKVERRIVAEEPGRAWHPLRGLDNIAMPTPVLRLLKAIRID